jgi:hypothetical protein
MAALFFYDVFLISQNPCGLIKFGLGTHFSKTCSCQIFNGIFQYLKIVFIQIADFDLNYWAFPH